MSATETATPASVAVMKIPLDVGMYASAEAARLARISPKRMLRWLRGREIPSWARERRRRPVLRHDLPEISGATALSFLDLIEVRMVKAFLDEGVSMHTIRAAAAAAATLFKSDHPFCLKKFETDGRTIFARLEEDHVQGHGRPKEAILLDLQRGQTAIPKVIEPLLRQIVYVNEVSAQWWPLGRRGGVVINPRLAFGVPVVARCGVPTDTLAGAARAEGSVQLAADWYDVRPNDVRLAVRFESWLAAA